MFELFSRLYKFTLRVNCHILFRFLLVKVQPQYLFACIIVTKYNINDHIIQRINAQLVFKGLQTLVMLHALNHHLNHLL